MDRHVGVDGVRRSVQAARSSVARRSARIRRPRSLRSCVRRQLRIRGADPHSSTSRSLRDAPALGVPPRVAHERQHRLRRDRARGHPDCAGDRRGHLRLPVPTGTRCRPRGAAQGGSGAGAGSIPVTPGGLPRRAWRPPPGRCRDPRHSRGHGDTGDHGRIPTPPRRSHRSAAQPRCPPPSAVRRPRERRRHRRFGARLPHCRDRRVSFLAPLLAIFGLSVPAIIVLYILKVRRREVVVPSTLLWRGDAVDRQASVPWQRIRPSWLLFLQLLAAIALVLALTRPALAQPAQLGPDTVVIIDSSGPMRATDVSPSRFDAAVSQTRALVDQLGPGQRMTLIAMDANPRVIAASGGDHGVLDAALSALRPDAGLADLRTALTLATAAPGGGGDRRVIVISDGVVDISGPTVSLPYPIQYRPVGVSGANLGISGITVSGTGGSHVVAINVTNYGTARRATTLETRADGHLVDARLIDAEPGGSGEVDVALSGSPQTVTANLTPHDAFPLDDTASAVVQAPRVIHAVLVTQGNIFLQEALQLRGDIHLDVETPASYRPRSDVDLWIFDGFVPPVLPAQPYWLLGAPRRPGDRRRR